MGKNLPLQMFQILSRLLDPRKLGTSPLPQYAKVVFSHRLSSLSALGREMYFWQVYDFQNDALVDHSQVCLDGRSTWNCQNTTQGWCITRATNPHPFRLDIRHEGTFSKSSARIMHCNCDNVRLCLVLDRRRAHTMHILYLKQRET